MANPALAPTATESKLASTETPSATAAPTGETVVNFVKPESHLSVVSASVPASPFCAPAKTFTQTGPQGIRFDFNDGCRVSTPGGDWRVVVRDTEAEVTLFDMPISTPEGQTGGATSIKKYFVPFQLEVWKGGEKVFEHTMNLKDREVLIELPVGTLGDTVGWFPYAVKFAKLHGCKLTVSMAKPLIPLFAKMYPSINLRTPEEINVESFYASYRVGLFFSDWENKQQPSDFRLVGLHRTAGYILGVDLTEERPLLDIPDDSRPIPEKYVVIATQASTQCKYWNHLDGWREIIRFLKAEGYRVICIDQKPVAGSERDHVWNHIPHGCEDQTGNRPLSERARWLKHADFFIGLSSGLSWLAWATGVPVVMISGFTHPTNEFHTPYRVTNFHTCNSCWNDPKVMFDHSDFMWCPRKAGTPQQFECTRLITPEHVKKVIRTIPAFASREKEVEVSQ
ncbi:autotransporter strand-loop-strand O-heptosyltransferase (plasmid) [Burkholderia vietnamiensis]|uniref:Glycosyltransferase n=1 Tax=Burkholderia vietnamiensis (strain G4 / LMG 22486) TaxID=269482 RepID=A4JU49_BURVG|nr:glycosyltransferase [Burkholderia vietnamiensis G4]MCB4350036.1 autotransporter strand-loop-strand O-heptosyltransferase [Burkholderia vietnamiensis]